jgi:hypothetical protein
MLEYIKIINKIKEKYPELNIHISLDRLYVGEKKFKISGILCSNINMNSENDVNFILTEIKKQYLDKKMYYM